MTEKECRVERCKLDVRDAESKLREAIAAKEQGMKKALADCAREEARLTEEVTRAKNAVEKEKAYLVLAESELERF